MVGVRRRKKLKKIVYHYQIRKERVLTYNVPRSILSVLKYNAILIQF